MHKFYKYLSYIWFSIVFLGVPAGFTYILFSDITYSASPKVVLFFALSTFFTSFGNIFLRHQDYLVWPQILKMLLSIYITIVGFATIYKQEGLIYGAEVIHDAGSAFYFSIVTWTTLGYGDFQPTESIRWLAAVEALMGTLFIPLFLASIIFILQLVESRNQSKKDM